ncbi:MAG: hypothetical protein M1840_004659 [Geoglossum simile]|nr:MAG: hypothetical protein M1840_004659 [Geoglossum simile]
MSAVVAKQATVTLTAVNFPDEHSPRVLKLTPSASIVKIGRASKSASKNLHPGPNNAWFDSPVISREHAQLSLVQNPKSVSLTDIGSMHGTKIDGNQLKEKEIHKIASDQTVTFGSEIARGPDVFPPRQFRVHIEWDDWSPPTPISSSPITNSPNRAYGIADDDLMISSEEGTSDGGSFAEKSPSIPAQSLHSYQLQTTASVTGGSTFIVPDSEPSSPCPRTSDCGTRERDRVRVRAQEPSDSQEEASQHRDTICCRAELVDIEFSGPTGLTEEEKAEDEGLFLTTNSAELLFNRYSAAGSTSSSPRRQAKDVTIIDLVEKTGDASNPVVIDETPDREGVSKIDGSRPSLWGKLARPALGQDIKEDEEYSPPPASAYGNESCGDSDYEMEIPVYESGSDEDGGKEALDGDLVSEDEFDNEGWSRPVSDHDESVFDYYDEPSEAEDGISDDDMEEASSQHGPEPSKLPVMTEAMKALEEDTVEDFSNTLKKRIAGSPSRTPPAAPTTLAEGSQNCASSTSCPTARELSHPDTQYQGTTCSLPPIQKMKVSEALSPIFFPHDLPPKPRAPSPSDAAMVKTPSIQANLNVHPIPKLRFGEPLPQNHSISNETHEAIDKEAHSSNGNRAELAAPTSGVDCVDTPGSLRAVNARKLGELSGKSEFFQAREANRREVFPIEPEMLTAPQMIMATTKVHPTSDLDYLFCFEPASKCESESQDINSQRLSGVFRDFASTTSEAGSFTAADELFSLPYTTDSARQGEFRDTGYSNVTSAAGLRKDFENWMKERDMDDYNPGAETVNPSGGVRIPQEGQELVSSSRVSIRNIVDPVGEVPSLKAEATRPYALPYAGSKRKADEISSLDVANAHRPESYQEQPQPGVFDDCPMAEAQPRDQDEFAPLEALISSDSLLQCESTHADEPPSKRVKFTAEPKRSGIAKFAATALAGAVIGGIGVFAALVASAPSA